jgi:hypothetical protein
MRKLLLEIKETLQWKSISEEETKEALERYRKERDERIEAKRAARAAAAKVSLRTDGEDSPISHDPPPAPRKVEQATQTAASSKQNMMLAFKLMIPFPRPRTQVPLMS